VHDPEPLLAIANVALAGVGDDTLGWWIEVGDIAVHLRRRLSLAEAVGVGPVVDVRGTWEMTKRLNAVRRYLPEALHGSPMRRCSEGPYIPRRLSYDGSYAYEIYTARTDQAESSIR
jgi:hypothetical protein